MVSVHKINMWVNRKHFKCINGLIMIIFCFLSENTAETLFCFQSKENWLTFPTRERVWVLKYEDINLKYYSHLLCTSPNHQLCNLTISTNSLNEKQKLHHLLGQQCERWRLGQRCAAPPSLCYELWLNLLIFTLCRSHI